MSATSWGSSLNSDAAVEAATNMWGTIVHPTIAEIVLMVLAFYDKEKAADPTVQWEEVVMFKMDLKSAYTLLFFRPDEIPKLGIPLAGGLVMLVMCGVFGWACTPFAFQVITRAILFELKRKLRGVALMYVDDIIGATLQRFLQGDLKISEEVCTGLLGPKAVAPEKTEAGRRNDVVGWVLDLERRLITIAKKNYLRALHGFFSLGHGGTFLLPEMEKMASWAVRYGLVFRGLRPLASWLYNATAGRKNRHAIHRLPEDASVVITMWRVVLCLGYLQEITMCRTLESFRPTPARFVVQFDASLSGIGMMWYRREPNGGELCLGGAAVSLAEFSFGEDSQYQNVAEFMAIVIGVAGLVAWAKVVGVVAGDHLILRGDSVSALSWAFKERSRSYLARNALIVFVALCSALDFYVDEIVHVAGDNNGICDALSRGTIPEDLQLEDWAVADNASVLQALRLCDPRRDSSNLGSFCELWSEAQGVARGLRRFLL
jgi:hypothetical protein